MSQVKWIAFVMLAGSLGGCVDAGSSPGSAVSANVPALSPVTSDGSVSPDKPAAPGAPVMSQFTATPIAGLPQCSQYTVTATVKGKPQPLNGEACLQADGSWHIAEQPAGGTVVYQTVYWPPGDVGYDDVCDDVFDDPCLYDFPFGFSIGFPVFVDVRHHFHHFGDFGHGGHFGHFGPIDHFPHHGSFGHEGGFHGGFSGGFHGGGYSHR